MSHNHFFNTAEKYLKQFDDRCKNIGFNFVTAVVAIHLGSWIWVNDAYLSEFIFLGYLSGIIGFYLSNLCYLVLKYIIEQCVNHVDEQAQTTVCVLLKISARMMSMLSGFLVSDILLSIPEMNTGVVFLTGLVTILFFIGLGTGIGLIDLNEDEPLEPGTPMMNNIHHL